ncbi:Uncharacterized protein HZ326_12791 [Fusarium oxysporum f. sp. albedinis]|nr:Uncharacterized protein HZ326_12791 [Fusarium oxysporum f. sp. albedinis]
MLFHRSAAKANIESHRYEGRSEGRVQLVFIKFSLIFGRHPYFLQNAISISAKTSSVKSASAALIGAFKSIQNCPEQAAQINV